MENQAPGIYENAKINLADSLAKPYLDLAIQIAQGSISFLSKDLLTALKEVRNDSPRQDRATPTRGRSAQ
jgi:hypothetical protein